jgi:hypothetical protein
MRMLLKQEKMYAYVYEGKRYDTGDKLGFLKATVEFALKRPDLGGPFREYLRNLNFYRQASGFVTSFSGKTSLFAELKETSLAR